MVSRLRVVVPLPRYPDPRADRTETETGLVQNHLWMLREVEVLRRACSVTTVSSQEAAFLASWREHFDVMYLPCELCYRTAGVAAREGLPFVMRVFVPPPPRGALAPDSIWADILEMLRHSRCGVVAGNTTPCVDALCDVGVAVVANPLPHVMPGAEPRQGTREPRYTYLGRLGTKSVDDLVRAASAARVPLRIGCVAAADEETTHAQVNAVLRCGVDLHVEIELVAARSLVEVDDLIDSSIAVVSASHIDTFWMPGIEALARGRDCRIVGNEYTQAAYGAWANTGAWQALGTWMAMGRVAAPKRCRERLREMGSDAAGYLERVVPLLEGAARV